MNGNPYCAYTPNQICAEIGDIKVYSVLRAQWNARSFRQIDIAMGEHAKLVKRLENIGKRTIATAARARYVESRTIDNVWNSICSAD